MKISVRSFAKVNLGLQIGSLRPDGFHELRTVYQTIALNDVVRVSIERGSGIEIRCEDARVPLDSTNTCYRTVERAAETWQVPGRVVIEIEKRLPVQGGLGGASGNGVAAMLALETALRKQLPGKDKLRIAAEVGSDLPLFLIGGTVLGIGRGEEVYPLPDLPTIPCVIALPKIAVSTPKAFADWDRLTPSNCRSALASVDEQSAVSAGKADCSHPSKARPLGMTHLERTGKLKNPAPSDRMSEFSREISAWLTAASGEGVRRSGVSAEGGGRAENLLLDLVRTGIENDFEKVVFPKHPELREVKRVLETSGAIYASLSGSGSAIYGLFGSRERAAAAVKKLEKRGTRAVITSTLTRRQYWKKFLVSSF